MRNGFSPRLMLQSRPRPKANRRGCRMHGRAGRAARGSRAMVFSSSKETPETLHAPARFNFMAHFRRISATNTDAEVTLIRRYSFAHVELCWPSIGAGVTIRLALSP